MTGRSDTVMVGRAASGLSTLLSIWKEDGIPKKIALPSLLCQSPLAAVLYAGWEPVFCDIDPETGNVPLNEWMRVINHGVHAVLFVHLYGNVGDAGRIAAICRSRNVYFIEDAAQSLGGSWEGQPCGSFGDASIISFGHTKLIDVGHGGAVATDDPDLANEVKTTESRRTEYPPNPETIANNFRENFYAARRQLVSNPGRGAEYFRGLIDSYMPLVAVRWRPEVSEDILHRLETLDTLVRERREKYELYKALLRDTPLAPLRMSLGSVPWRAVFRLPGIDWAVQNAISEAVRKNGVDLSNWYIPSHWLMQDQHESGIDLLRSTEQLSQEIFQLWIDAKTDKDEIKRAACVFAATISAMS